MNKYVVNIYDSEYQKNYTEYLIETDLSAVEMYVKLKEIRNKVEKALVEVDEGVNTEMFSSTYEGITKLLLEEFPNAEHIESFSVDVVFNAVLDKDERGI